MSRSINLGALTIKLRTAIDGIGLSTFADQIVAVAKPAILLELHESEESGIAIGASKIGGRPDLPVDYPWPEWKGKPMGFVGQIDLSQASQYDLQSRLPTEGLLSFFYDFYEQPWGYDPKELGFSRVEYFPPETLFTETLLIRRDLPDSKIYLKCSSIYFSPSLTLPVSGSQSYDLLLKDLQLNEDDREKYWNLPDRLQSAYRRQKSPAHHQLLGHSLNVQGDMQLEAELVTNGLYAGDSSGYDDPRVEALEPISAEWELLFQLDSDDAGELLWGDNGMLYYWLRRSDLIDRKFEKHWMALQCF